MIDSWTKIIEKPSGECLQYWKKKIENCHPRFLYPANCLSKNDFPTNTLKVKIGFISTPSINFLITIYISPSHLSPGNHWSAFFYYRFVCILRNFINQSHRVCILFLIWIFLLSILILRFLLICVLTVFSFLFLESVHYTDIIQFFSLFT